MHIRWTWAEALHCPQCRHKEVYILSDTIMCFACSWHRSRKYPVPEEPLHISVQGTDDPAELSRRIWDAIARYRLAYPVGKKRFER